jgi:hypothetical protein
MPVTRPGGLGPPSERRTKIFATTRERDGYDFMRGDVKLWFAGWGNVPKTDWTTREANGGPPTPAQLASARLITFGMEFPNGFVDYKTRKGGLDV